MINSYQELLNTIDNVNCGEPKFQLVAYEGGFNVIPLNKLDLKSQLNTDYWLECIVASCFSRAFDKEHKVWKVKWNVLPRIRNAIVDELTYVITKCSDAKEPSRTKLYKDWKAIINDKSGREDLMTDIISILNYYHSATTDQTRNSNVIGLLTILRKKYGQKV